MANPSDSTHTQEMYDAYVAAEKAILSGQSYTIGGRQLTRANLKEVQDGRAYWSRQLQLVASTESNKPRVSRIVPL